MLPTLELQDTWKDSPIKFIEDQWGLIPQPLCCEEAHEHIWKCYGEFIKGKHITWQQTFLLKAVENALQGKAVRRISVAGGHGFGKSTVLAWLTLWFLITRKHAQIGTTAPTSDQLFDVLFKEIAVWHQKLTPAVQKIFVLESGAVRVSASPKTWFARGRTARKESPEAFAGLHGEHVGLFADEASGVAEEIYRVGEGSLTNKDTLIILISNPTRLEGYFYQTHHEDKKNWQTFQFSSIESPIVDPAFVERIKAKYGEDSDEYRFMVLGQFPKGGGMIDGWMPMFTEEDIKNETQDIGAFTKPVYVGVDPSGLGANQTSLCVRDAFKAKIVDRQQKSDPLKVAEKIVTIIMHYEAKPENVIVDNFGQGANVAQEVALGVHERVRPVNVGYKATDERFLNLRAEMYWLGREWLRKGGKLVKGGNWRGLLTIYYRRTTTGRIQIMGKAEMVKRGWDSPDDCDAWALTFIPNTANREQIASQSRTRTEMSDEEVANVVSVY